MRAGDTRMSRQGAVENNGDAFGRWSQFDLESSGDSV